MNIKKLIILLAIIFSATLLYAQEDRFSEVSQTIGKDIYILDNSALNVAFTIVDGKVKPIQKVKNMNVSMAGKVYSVENSEYNYKKNCYIVLKGSNETILLKPEDAPLYLSSFISKTYWQEKYDSYRNDYVFLDFKKYPQVHSQNATVEYDDLARIEWRGLEISEKGALYNMCEYNGVYPLANFKVTSSLFEKYKGIYFVKEEDIQPYVEKYNVRLAKEKRDKEIADSITNSKLRLAIALDEATFNDDGREIKVRKGDTLAIFSYNATDDEFVARFRYSNLLFRTEQLEFLDTKTSEIKGRYSWENKTIKKSADADFLKSKGEDGKTQRFNVAAEYDDVNTAIWIGKLQAAIDDYNKEIAYKKKNQIFITGIGYVFDSNEYSHSFGMRFDIYNCFSKTIKYVEFTLTNYNAVGDVQRDDIGHSSRIVRGIGPIDPADGGRFSWDDIFWDARGVIEKTKLTNIKFIFKDGTTKVYSGNANINKHITSDAWD